MTGTIVVDVNVTIFGIQAAGGIGGTKTSLPIDSAIREPGFITIGANVATCFRLLGTFGYAYTFGFGAMHLTDTTGTAMHLLTWIN